MTPQAETRVNTGQSHQTERSGLFHADWLLEVEGMAAIG